MNCPSPVHYPEGDGMNQNPNALSPALTTNQDLNGMVNLKALRRLSSIEHTTEDEPFQESAPHRDKATVVREDQAPEGESSPQVEGEASSGPPGNSGPGKLRAVPRRLFDVVMTFGKFVGPGFMISVAYIDPGNYSTDVAAGASYRFRLLFVVLMSNIFAILLQSLSIKLGSVTGLNLAEACRAFLPKWLNIALYILAEAAIIATDIAEVIGTAIAINLLIPKIPLVAGCALSIADVLLLLLFYRPNGSMKGLRAFELFVVALVMGVVICFCIQLSLIKDTSVGEVFKGYLPSSALIQSEGLYQACGILGATVMPHSLYLGSGIVQPRLQEYDVKAGLFEVPDDSSESSKEPYIPSLRAINYCLNYSIAELTISLFTFALFVNSAILIVAGASLSDLEGASSADLFGIYHLLSSSLAPAAGTVFALALLLSGISAGIICTIAGQMVSEGALNWTLAPWLRRLITRSISITPSIIIAGAVGREGLTAALNGTQVALSVVLPFVSAPLIYFTCRNKYMTVRDPGAASRVVEDGEEVADADASGDGPAPTKMRNHWVTATFAVVIWVVIAAMNVANLVLTGRGES